MACNALDDCFDGRTVMKLLSLTHRFWQNRHGNVAFTFALASLPLIAFAGTAVDYGLATRLVVLP